VDQPPPVNCGGSFGPVDVSPGNHTVDESAAGTTNLADYATTLVCEPVAVTNENLTGPQRTGDIT